MNELITEAAWRHIQEKYGLTGSPADFILEHGWELTIQGEGLDLIKHPDCPYFDASGGDLAKHIQARTLEGIIYAGIDELEQRKTRRAAQVTARRQFVATILREGTAILTEPVDNCTAAVLYFLYGIKLRGQELRKYDSASVMPAPAKEAQ